MPNAHAATPPTQASPPGPPRGGRVLKIVNPATGAPLREMAEDGPEAIARKAQKARREQAEWARTPLATRMALMQDVVRATIVYHDAAVAEAGDR